MITQLMNILGYNRAINGFDELKSEIEYMQDKAGVTVPLKAPYATDDGKS